MNIDLAAIQADIENALRQMHSANPKARLRRIQIKDYTARLATGLATVTEGDNKLLLQEIAGPRSCGLDEYPRYLMCDWLSVCIHLDTGRWTVVARRRMEREYTADHEPAEISVSLHKKVGRLS